MLRLLPALLTGLCIAMAAAAPIKVGELGILSDAPLYIAIEKTTFPQRSSM